MKLSLSLVSAFALLTTPVAMAQNAVDVPVNVEIINQSDLVSLSVAAEGDLGQIARAANVQCLYEFERGQLTIRDFQSGEKVPAPGAVSSGCAQFGNSQPPVLTVTCAPGMNLPLVVSADIRSDNVGFSAREVSFAGTWYGGNLVGEDTEFLLTCPAGNTATTSTHELVLSIYGVIDGTVDAVTNGVLDVNLPVSVVFE